MLANLFMHYAFDNLMSREFPNVNWVRYADDGALNCVSLKQAKYMIKVLDKRFKLFGLELNLTKTKIVYCKDSDRKGNYENITFDFLGYTFKPRYVKCGKKKGFTGFLPAISDKAKKAIKQEVKEWKMQRKVNKNIRDIANMYNSKIQGWINYYSHYYKSEMYDIIRYINKCIIKWVRRKYKFNSTRKSVNWLKRVMQNEPKLFAHWKSEKFVMAI